jgi:hypothetical protein
MRYPMTKMHSIEEYHPLRITDLSRVFSTSSSKKMLRNNALLYQDILAYGKNKTEGFKFTELANWLLQNNREFMHEFSGSNAKTPRSTRLAIKRNRIQRHIDNLMQLGLVYEKNRIKGAKNQSSTVLYDYTLPGYLITWLLDINYLDKATETDEPTQKILNVIHSYATLKDSASITFISNFFDRCKKRGTFNSVVSYFLESIMTNSTITDGYHLLRLFLGQSHSLNWILADCESFIEALNSLDENIRKIVLFEIKMEVEDWQYSKMIDDIYKNSRVIAQDIHYQGLLNIVGHYQGLLNIVGIPGKKWQLMRFNNISNHSNVVVPGFCSGCNKEQPFLVHVYKYFNRIIAAHRPYPFNGISQDCDGCGKALGSTCRVIQLPWFLSPWS